MYAVVGVIALLQAGHYRNWLNYGACSFKFESTKLGASVQYRLQWKVLSRLLSAKVLSSHGAQCKMLGSSTSVVVQ